MTGSGKAGKSLAFFPVILLILVIFSGCIAIQTDDQGKNTSSPLKKIASRNSQIISNDTAAPSQVTYLQAERGSTWLNWTWDNPADEDFNYTIIYIDGKFKTNVYRNKNYYNLTNLQPDRQYRIGIRTADINKNVNPEWVNATISTLPKNKDKIAPDKIWYLDSTAGRNWINWTWENPDDEDFSHVMISINGMFKSNVSKTRSYYNLTQLPNNTKYTISIRTVDKNKNINYNSVTDITTTLP